MTILQFLGWRGLAGIALAAALSVMLVAAKMDARHWHKLADQNAARAELLQTKLDSLASESQQKQQSVAKVIDHYITVTKPEMRTKVERIMSAPLPGNCRTPQEIIDADI